MRTIFSLLIVSFLLSTVATAQDNPVNFGFGVNFTREMTIISTGADDLGVYTLPIDLANFSIIIRGTNFRIEPSLGYFSTSSDYSSQGYTSKSSTSNFRIGSLVAYNNNSIESMNFYYGLVFGALFTSSSSENNYPGSTNNDESKTDFFIGPAVGGEYMFNDHFSFGGEINVNYISIGQYDSDNSDYDISQSAISTRGIIYVRWYVN